MPRVCEPSMIGQTRAGTTVRTRVPLNNRLQALEVDSMEDVAIEEARQAFEPRWNRWNVIRTVAACATTVLLLIILVGLQGP